MSEGPVSLTTLIGSSAFIIATGFGVIYSKETVNAFQIMGMTVLVLSLVFCVNPKKSGEKLTGKWFLYSFLFFLAGGFLGIFNKIFGASDVSGEVTGMMLVASVVSAVGFTVSGFIINSATGVPCPEIRKESIFYIIASGLASCIYIRLNASLAGIIPSAVFFPVSNGAMVILSAISGRILFKEKLKKIQVFGIETGLAAIIITGCGNVIFKWIIS